MLYARISLHIFIHEEQKIRFIPHTSKGEFSENFLKMCMIRPVASTAITVPGPIPKNRRDENNPMTSVTMTQKESNRFLLKPISLPITCPMALTIPSPGFGIILMFTVKAAPIPVSSMAAASVMICDGSVEG